MSIDYSIVVYNLVWSGLATIQVLLVRAGPVCWAYSSLWFNRRMGPKLKSFILAIFSPVCNGGFGHRIM